jgi:hypothetical protein
MLTLLGGVLGLGEGLGEGDGLGEGEGLGEGDGLGGGLGEGDVPDPPDGTILMSAQLLKYSGCAEVAPQNPGLPPYTALMPLAYTPQ